MVSSRRIAIQKIIPYEKTSEGVLIHVSIAIWYIFKHQICF